MNNLRVVEGNNQEQRIQIPAFVNQKGEAATRAYKERVARMEKVARNRRKVSNFADNFVCALLVALFTLLAGIGIGTCLRQVVGEVWMQTPTSTKVVVVASIGLTLFLLVCNIFGKSGEEKERG